MSKNRDSSWLGARRSERGQALPLLLVVWVVFVLAMAALVVDVGNVYASYRQLQAATDAAALAGAQGLSLTNTTGLSNATLYSALSGQKNFYSNLQNVAMVSGYPKLKCLTTLSGAGLGCDGSTTYNAIDVKEQANVPLYFASVLGVHSMQIATESKASVRGANPGPFNIIIIVDATGSMASTNDAGDCNNLRLVCALEGVQVFLEDLAPCPQGAACTVTDQNSANPVDEVALMIFPGVAQTWNNAHTTMLDPVQDSLAVVTGAWLKPWQHPYEYDTLANTPTSSLQYTAYGATPVQPTQFLPANVSSYEQEYQIVELSSDYRTSDTAASLNTASDLVKAVANPVQNNNILVTTGPGTNPGLSDLAGENTFYAGTLYAAQAELEARARPGAQNIIILLSDGDANAGSSKFAGTLSGNGTYIDSSQECHQAITAATYAKANSPATTIYVVAYGAAVAGGGGCSTDTNPSIDPCTTLQDIATSPKQFYSDTASSQRTACTSAVNQGSNNLQAIFGSIASALQVARLVPNSTP